MDVGETIAGWVWIGVVTHAGFVPVAQFCQIAPDMTASEPASAIQRSQAPGGAPGRQELPTKARPFGDGTFVISLTEVGTGGTLVLIGLLTRKRPPLALFTVT